MGILDALDRLVANADPRSVRPADPNDWPTLNEPLQDTPGESTDLGQIVDRTNANDAGGYPAAVPADLGPFRGEITAGANDHECESCKDAKNRPQPIEWKSARYTFTATDTRPIVVTPSGADADRVLCVSLIASIAGFRIGPTENDALAGGRLPASAVLQVYAGPVYIANPDGVAGTVDVFVEYQTT